MKFEESLSSLLENIEVHSIEGPQDRIISGIASLKNGQSGDLGFFRGNKISDSFKKSHLGAILVSVELSGTPADGQTWVRVKDPSLTLSAISAQLLSKYRPKPNPGVHPTALIEEGVELGEGSCVGPFCVLRSGSSIGRNSILQSRVTLESRATLGEDCEIGDGVFVGWDCQMGDRCRVFPGAVFGADGFGYESSPKGHQKLAQIGNVVVGSDVEIGANACIDRARFASTRIGDGSKIDNLVQIGHNVIIGKNCIICAQVGISGSTHFGDFVILAGQVGVAGHIQIGDGVIATGQTGITKSIPAGTTLTGTPGHSRVEELRILSLVRRLPQWKDRLEEIERRLGIPS